MPRTRRPGREMAPSAPPTAGRRKPHMLTLDLSGKLALVTGASGGLGRVMIRTLADCGADVVVHYAHNQAMAGQLVREVRAKGRQALAVQADITDPAAVQAMQARVAREARDPDIVVTNAVIQIFPWKPVLDEGLDSYESQFRSCVMQNVLMAKAFVPAMVRRGWGRVIGINTECTTQYAPGQSAYTSGKGGMDRLLRVLAKEVGPSGITVNQIAPGWMLTDRDRTAGPADPTEPKGYTEHVPLRRRGADQEIANLAAFLASDLAGFITGAFIPVNGGNTMVAI